MHGDLLRPPVPTERRPAQGPGPGGQEGSQEAHAVPRPQSDHDEQERKLLEPVGNC